MCVCPHGEEIGEREKEKGKAGSKCKNAKSKKKIEEEGRIIHGRRRERRGRENATKTPPNTKPATMPAQQINVFLSLSSSHEYAEGREGCSGRWCVVGGRSLVTKCHCHVRAQEEPQHGRRLHTHTHMQKEMGIQPKPILSLSLSQKQAGRSHTVISR